MIQIWVQNNQESLFFITPELLLLGMGILFLGLSLGKWTDKRWMIGVSSIGFFAAQVLSWVGFNEMGSSQTLFSELLILDPFTMFCRSFFLLACALTSFFMFYSKTFSHPKKFLEALAFLFVLNAGLHFMAMSIDVLMTILSMEMVSILSYLLVASRPKDAFSSEAGLKYLLFGAVASGIMFYGFSFLYGWTGTSSYAGIAPLLEGQPLLLFFSMVCILMGMGFKMTIFPTQMWSPDVYQGAPTSITAFLSVASKSVGFFILIRFLSQISAFAIDFAALVESIRLHEVLSFFAVASMLIGNVSALKQKSLKRLMAYSSIAHAGFILLGMTTFTQVGVQAVLFYLVVYLFMNLGAFYIIHIRILDTNHDHIDAFRGYGNQNVWMSVSMSIFLFSLIGLPPFSGFIAKFYIFTSLIAQKHYILATLGAINTAIAIYYYMKIMKWMFFKEGNDPVLPSYSVWSKGFVLLLLIPVIGLGIYWEPVRNWISFSVSTLF